MNSLRKLNSAWLAGRSSAATGDVVLIADDSESDIFFLLRAIAESKVTNPIQIVRTGQEAIAYLAGEAPFNYRERFPFPTVVFVDLKMPPLDGLEILKWKQSRAEFEDVLFVAMSNFDSVGAINKAYAAGASTFLSKPLNPDDIRNVIHGFAGYWELSNRPTSAAKALNKMSSHLSSLHAD